MSTAWVECWKCDECGHRWIKTEKWPEQCASSKCRKRSWNKMGRGGGVAERSPEMGSIRAEGSNPSPAPTRPDMAALRAICAGEGVTHGSESILPEVRAGHNIEDQSGGLHCDSYEAMHRKALSIEQEPASSIILCPHKEWAEDGEQYRCRLIAGHKGKCMPGERVS